MQKKPWAKKEMRQQNIKKLRTALQNCGKAESESVEEFEQQIMDKSRTMEDYLQNVAKVLVHCSSKMQNRHMGGQVAHNSSMMPGMHGPGQGGPTHHPPSQAAQQGMMQMHPGQMNQVDPGTAMMGPGMAPNAGNVPMGMIQRRQMFSNPNLHPGSPHVQSTQAQPDEDTLYAMKLAELQKKYIVPLQKLKEKNAQKKTGEMKRIDEVLDVLMSSRKIKMENLVNIESVLFKLFTNKSSSSVESGSVDRAPMSADKAAHSAPAGSVDKSGQQSGTATRNTHFCQPLIDGVANHACNSSFFHTVRRTFGLGLYSLHGDITQYPPAKKPKKGEPSTLEILDSEMERLPSIFKAQVRNRARGDLEIQVKHLKHSIVPCLSVILPKKYPEQSPWVKATRNKLGKEIEKELENKLISMSMNCTLTEILLYWEVCIKKCLKNRISRVRET